MKPGSISQLLWKTCGLRKKWGYSQQVGVGVVVVAVEVVVVVAVGVVEVLGVVVVVIDPFRGIDI